jgi:hypothetical protein
MAFSKFCQKIGPAALDCQIFRVRALISLIQLAVFLLVKLSQLLIGHARRLVNQSAVITNPVGDVLVPEFAPVKDAALHAAT